MLQRLRAALFLDTTLPTEPVQQALERIDSLCLLLKGMTVKGVGPAVDSG